MCMCVYVCARARVCVCVCVFLLDYQSDGARAKARGEAPRGTARLNSYLMGVAPR